ncbi:MAG: diguanylate cyclase [Anaerolineales bacterium]|nr:diguanylate cyclase [Anaerolineales bacterium]
MHDETTIEMGAVDIHRIAYLSKDGFFRVTFGRGVVWVNDSFLEITGAVKADLLHQPQAWQRLFSPRGVQDLLSVYEMFTKNPDICLSFPVEMNAHEGDGIWLEITMIGTVDKEGKCTGVEGYVRDVSEYVRVTELLSHKTQEQKILLEVQRDLLGELNLKESLSAVVKKARDILDATDATLFLVQEDGISLRPVACAGPYQDVLNELEIKIGEGIAGRVVKNQQPVLISHVADCSDAVLVPNTPAEDESIICTPLILKGQTIGALLVGAPPEHFEEKDLRSLIAITQVATLAVANSQLFSEVQHMAEVDDMTGAYNRYFFNRMLRDEISLARSRGYPVSVLMLDIDELKPINDQYGHVSGDRLLKTTVRVLKRKLRDVDWIARIGGDEFAVVLPGCPREKLPEVAEKLQHALRASSFKPAQDQPGGIRASIGGTTFPDGADNLEEIMLAIDRAELQAKQAGGDQFVLATFSIQ